MLTTNWTNCLL